MKRIGYFLYVNKSDIVRILKMKYANICAHLRIMNSRKPKVAGDNAATKSCPVRLFEICPNRYKTE